MKRSFVDWMIDHQRSLIFLVAVLAIGGLLSAFNLPVSLFPHTDFPRIRVSLDAGDQPAERMELEVTRPMELAVRSVPGIQAIHSTTSRGSAEIIADFPWGTNTVEKQLQIEGAVSKALTQTPAGTTFDVERMETSLYPVAAFSLTSTTASPTALRNLAEFQLRPLLASLPGVASIGIQGGATAEYHVDVEPAKLRELGVSFDDVTKALASQNLLQSVGRLRDHSQLYLVVADSQLETLDAIEQVVIKTGDDGVVHLGQIAQVTLATAPNWVSVRADGQPAVLLNIFQQPNGNTLAIVKAVQQTLAANRDLIPASVQLHQWYDQSELVAASATSVRDAMLIGVVIAALVLLVFLRSWKVALVAAITVPVVLAITTLLLKVLHQDFNIMTLGGMAAAIGLFIDDAVVVIEHLIRRMRETHSYAPTTLIAAAREFTQPLLGSSLSTIIIFAPLAFLGGITGAFFSALSLTMASGLIISFFVSWLVVPTLSTWLLRESDAATEKDGILARRFKPFYQRIMTRNLSTPRWVLLALVPLLLIGFISYRATGSGFMPPQDEGGFILDYQGKPGASLDEMNRLLSQVGDIIQHDPAVQTWSLRTGTQLGGGVTETDTGDFFIKLKPFPRAPIETVMERIRTQVTERVPELDIDTGQLMQDIIGDLTSQPQPVVIKLFGNDSKQLRALAPAIAKRIERIPGIVEVRDGIVIAGSSLDIAIDPVRAALKGVTPADISAQVSTQLQGTVATRVQNGIQFTGIRVELPPTLRATTDQVENLTLHSPSGEHFPLRAVAKVTAISGQPEITRQDMKRTVTVSARISGRDLGSTIQAVKAALAEPGVLPAGVYYQLGGLYQQQQQAFRGLLLVFLTALTLVFVLLLFLYESFRVALCIIVQPLLALCAVFFGLWITGTELNIMAMMGLTMIIGIVTEVAIFYFSEFQQLIRELPLREAIQQAGLNRARPIALTTLAFVLALLPLAFSLGRGSAMLAPLARSIIFGLLAQMPLVLILMPTFYFWIHTKQERQP